MGLGRVYSSGGLQGLHQQYISFTGSFCGSRLLVVHPVLSCCFPAYKSAHTYVSGLFKDHMYVGSSMTLSVNSTCGPIIFTLRISQYWLKLNTIAVFNLMMFIKVDIPEVWTIIFLQREILSGAELVVSFVIWLTLLVYFV